MAKEKTIKQLLDEQPKEKVRIPLNDRNPEDKTVSVIINGYRYVIKRGETVEVPVEVARTLEESKYI